MAAPAIGIDLGTTYSCVAVYQHNRVDIINNRSGNRTTPSHVTFDGDEVLVGDASKRQAIKRPTNSVFDVKRLIGNRFSDDFVKKYVKNWPFKVVQGDFDDPIIEVEYKGNTERFAPEEISAMILLHMKNIAEVYLKETVKDVVITVPAYFNNSQRTATVDAGKIAGLNILRIINEPTAAAIAYCYHTEAGRSGQKNVLVFDLGGGTFDVSLLTIGNDVFQVRALDGDPHLGGQDFTMSMANHFVHEIKDKHGLDISNKAKDFAKLKRACEEAKRELSEVDETKVCVESIIGGDDFYSKINQATFNKLNSNLFEKCIEHVEKCLKDAKMEKKDVNEIVLVGGSTRIPRVRKLLQDLFGGKQLSQGIHPDEAVAYGAAVQAAIIGGQLGEWKVKNVAAISLGISVNDGKMSVLIPRNTPIPTIAKMYFLLPANGKVVSTDVYEGESDRVKENNLLWPFKVPIPDPELNQHGSNVCFEIDENGILKVSEEFMNGAKVETSMALNKDKWTEDEIKNRMDRVQSLLAIKNQV